MDIKKKVLPKFRKYDINGGGAEYKDGLGWTKILFNEYKILKIISNLILKNKLTTLIIEDSQNYITDILLYGQIFTQIYKKKC